MCVYRIRKCLLNLDIYLIYLQHIEFQTIFIYLSSFFFFFLPCIKHVDKFVAKVKAMEIASNIVRFLNFKSKKFQIKSLCHVMCISVMSMFHR